LPVDPVYAPAEDSYLLAKWVERLAEGSVLDMGTGSGIQAVTAAKKKSVIRVTAVDINHVAIVSAGERAAREGVSDKIRFIESDLFADVSGRFDWILFNPPYLPSEGGAADATWDGGPTGAETIERFLDGAKSHLAEGGSILLIYSSETALKSSYGYEWSILEEKKLFFETLTCARLQLTHLDADREAD